MASDVEEIQREIEKTREHLRELQQRLKTRSGYMSDEERTKRIEAELKTKHPKASPDKELLSLVGVLPNPGIGYKKAVRRRFGPEFSHRADI